MACVSHRKPATAVSAACLLVAVLSSPTFGLPSHLCPPPWLHFYLCKMCMKLCNNFRVSLPTPSLACLLFFPPAGRSSRHTFVELGCNPLKSMMEVVLWADEAHRERKARIREW